MSNITPAGYIYGREPMQTNPFWEMQPDKPDIDVNEVMSLQDKRWLGIEDFPADYSITIDVSKVENKPNYRNEIKYALYQKEIDYLTIENASTVDSQNYIDSTVSGKIYTIKNSIIKTAASMQNRGGFHKVLIDNCTSEGSGADLGGSANDTLTHILEINNYAANNGSPVTFSIRSSTPASPQCCVLLKWDKSQDIYTIYFNYLKFFKQSKITFFVEDGKLQSYLANIDWAELSSQIRPLSEFKEEEWY